jgi:hypothetical protein
MSKAIYAQKMTYMLIFHDFSQFFSEQVEKMDQLNINARN